MGDVEKCSKGALGKLCRLCVFKFHVFIYMYDIYIYVCVKYIYIYKVYRDIYPINHSPLPRRNNSNPGPQVSTSCPLLVLQPAGCQRDPKLGSCQGHYNGQVILYILPETIILLMEASTRECPEKTPGSNSGRKHFPPPFFCGVSMSHAHWLPSRVLLFTNLWVGF